MTDRIIKLAQAINSWCLVAMAAALSAAGAQEPAHAVVAGKVRFDVLAPTLVRMEYSPTAKFIDVRSVSVVKRDWPAVPYQTRQLEGWMEIDSGKMTVRYRPGSRPFTAENLQVLWRDELGEHTWRPGDKDDKNLGGVRIPDIPMRREPGNEPGALSRNGYFWLDDSQTAIRDPANDWVRPRPEKDSQDWYFFVYGLDYKGMLSQLAQLLGPIPMVPRYVLGTWVGSRAGYSADEWKMIASRFREQRVPADLLVLDSNSFCKVIWSGYDIDEEQMPNPREFFHWMLNHGFHVTVNEHYGPLTRMNDSHFEAFLQLLGLPTDTQEVPHDLANQKYAQAFMELLHRPRLDMGMAFWWQDGWAPANMRGLDPALWTREIEYEGSERITAKRAFDFCRMGAWGSHRYGAYFTGDLAPYWSTLDLLIPYNVQGGNMLVAYINNLCAGVFLETVDPELYQRWVEFSSFSPLFWWHGLWGQRFPWEYGAKSLDITRKYLGLRYRLLPYLYTYTRLANETGLPLVRGTYLEYPNQEPAYSYRHQYLLGQELLVAPISEPSYGKPVLKDVYLPKGDDWFDFFTGQIYPGGEAVGQEYPVERMPLFVRAGSILPQAPEMDYSDQSPVDPLTLEVYAGKAATFRLYEDDGVSLDYRKGAYAWTPLRYTPDASGSHTIEIGPTKGQYQGQPQNRCYEVRVHGLLKPQAVKLGARRLEEKQASECGNGCGGWTWDGNAGITTIRLIDPIPIQEKTTLALEGVGTFGDAQTLQRTVAFRDRLRSVKQEEKLKWAMLLHGQDIKKPPRVLRETEKVETELNNLIANPHGVAKRRLDFKGMTEKVMRAFVDQPFESNRSIPEADVEAQKATRSIESGRFEPQEIREMTGQLLGCKLLARAFGTPSPLVETKLVGDAEATGPAQVRYEISFPDEGLPGWTLTQPAVVVEGGYTQFGTRVPFPPKLGAHVLKIRANMIWDGGQTEITRDVVWFATAEVPPQWKPWE